MNPFPAEMAEACQCKDEVVIWHPKMHLEKRQNDPKPQKKRTPIIRWTEATRPATEESKD
jgi:hypothetical protein